MIPRSCSALERGLREHGYVVDAVADGSAALRHLSAYDYDVAVLDWRMPQRSGVEVVEEARRHGHQTPILMLTAHDTASDRGTVVDVGADDYLVKPFDFAELIARLRALQRRPPVTLRPVLECGDLAFDPSTRVVSLGGTAIATTTIETSLIELLLRRSPTLVTRRMIGGLQVWSEEADAVGSNTIDVHVGASAPSSQAAGPRSRRSGAWAIGWSRREHDHPHLRHTVRVAAVATLLVMLCYVAAAIVVNLVVTNHLVGNVDARLSTASKTPASRALLPERPVTATTATSTMRRPSCGRSTPTARSRRSPGAPALPQRPWDSQAVSLDVGGSTFRFDSLHTDGTTLVAGESMASTANVQITLLLAEIVFGAILACAIFGGAMLVGLRAAAPSELVRRRRPDSRRTHPTSCARRSRSSRPKSSSRWAGRVTRRRTADILQRVGHESPRLRRIVEDLLWLARRGRRARAKRARRVDRRRRGRRGLHPALRGVGRDPRDRTGRRAHGPRAVHGRGARGSCSIDW